jgi:NB-ARC domain-containing protein
MVRWWRLALLTLAGVVAATAATLLAVAVNVATGGTAGWFGWVPGLAAWPQWWAVGATVGVAAGGVVAWGAQLWYERGLAGLVPAVQRREPWVVDRPAEVDKVVAALRHGPGGKTVGITTAVHGAGGFGKTTVAKIVRADGRVLRQFKHRVYWVTLGRDVRKEALASEVSGLLTQIEPGRPVTLTDARQAGERLAAVLPAGPRRLVVLDSPPVRNLSGRPGPPSRLASSPGGEQGRMVAVPGAAVGERLASHRDELPAV